MEIISGQWVLKELPTRPAWPPCRAEHLLSVYGLAGLTISEDGGVWGGVGRILREFNNLASKLSIDFKKFGNALNIELFFFGSQILPPSQLLWLLPGERGPPLEKTSFVNLSYNLEYVTK